MLHDLPVHAFDVHADSVSGLLQKNDMITVNKFLKYLPLMIPFWLISANGTAQYLVEIRVENAFINNYHGHGYGPRIRLYKDSWTDRLGTALWYEKDCIKLANTSTGLVSVQKNYSFTVPKSTFDLIVVTHEEHQAGHDGTEDCAQNGSDDFEASTTKPINLNDYAPGVFSSIFYVATLSGQSTVDTYMQIRYTPVKPERPSGPSQDCSDAPFTLSTPMPKTGLTNTTGLSYEWEFNIPANNTTNPDYAPCEASCNAKYQTCMMTDPTYCESYKQQCHIDCVTKNPPPPPIWEPLSGTHSGREITFNPMSAVFKGRLTSTTTVNFRVRAVGPELTGGFSDESSFSFMPPPPNGNPPVATEASCSLNGTVAGNGNGGTGKISVTGVTNQFAVYKFVLRKGPDTTLTCNPDVDNSCLKQGDISDTRSGASFEIPLVAPGSYTLFLLNNAGTTGFCPRKIGPVTVDAVKSLATNNFNYAALPCNDITNGSGTLTLTDGRPSTLTYDLVDAISGKSFNSNLTAGNAGVSFAQLPAGSYHLTASDQCTLPVVTPFILNQPVTLSEVEFQLSNATCSAPADGIASIKTARSTGPFDQSLSPVLHFQLFKSGVLFDEQQTTDDHHLWSNLPPDPNYTLYVKEAGGVDCNALIKNFAIDGPAPLSISTLNIVDVTCFGTTDGIVTLTGAGGNGSYTFQLTPVTGGTSLSNLTGNFTDLAPGDYLATVMNHSTCQDEYVQRITVNSPSSVTVQINKQDISCNGLTDGMVLSTVTGGTSGISGYTYIWETQIGASWTTLSNTFPVLTQQPSGDYRLRIKDSRLCDGVSNEVTVVEPLPISITSVQVHDVVCFGGTGSIDVIAGGGVAPYTLDYAQDGNSFTPSTNQTPLEAGSYAIRAKDHNGCWIDDPQMHLLTAPPTILTFQEKLSDFNGFNISCFGGNNGSASIVASGGNGGVYSGYSYAADNNPFQTDQTLTGLNAGTHVISVKDGRGCVVSKSLAFTQTTAKLFAVLTTKQDVFCMGDETGMLSFDGSGGLPPYQFSMDDGPFQTSGTFSNLQASAYTITVKDQNGCDNSSPQEITSINPEIRIETIATDVSCFGGSDGTITALVQGGVPPLRYGWTPVTANATFSVLEGIKAGSYTVKVSDQAGCSREGVTAVHQPDEALAMKLATIPVCYQKSNGSITAQVSGGTAPYQYAIGDALQYQTGPGFKRGVGDYVITAQDSKGCLISLSATIIQRNDKPEANFLVATKRNALDTLVVTDISVPIPDSSEWQFDPRAIVVSDDPKSPELRFTEPGIYTVSMTSYFAGCDYAVTKTITVNPYDPDIEKEKVPGYKPIESMTVAPNPSGGEFNVVAKLNKKYDLAMKVYDMLGILHYEKTWSSVDGLSEKVRLDNPVDGVYVVRLITESDAKDVRIVIHP